MKLVLDGKVGQNLVFGTVGLNCQDELCSLELIKFFVLIEFR